MWMYQQFLLCQCFHYVTVSTTSMFSQYHSFDYVCASWIFLWSVFSRVTNLFITKEHKYFCINIINVTQLIKALIARHHLVWYTDRVILHKHKLTQWNTQTMELSHHVQTLHVIHPAYTQPPPPNKHTPMGSIILYIILPKTTWLLTIKYKISCKFKKIILDSILLTAFKTFLHILYFSNNSVAKLTTPFRMPRNCVEFHMIVLLKLNQPVQGQHPPIMQKASGFLQILKPLLF